MIEQSVMSVNQGLSVWSPLKTAIPVLTVLSIMKLIRHTVLPVIKALFLARTKQTVKLKENVIRASTSWITEPVLPALLESTVMLQMLQPAKYAQLVTTALPTARHVTLVALVPLHPQRGLGNVLPVMLVLYLLERVEWSVLLALLEQYHQKWGEVCVRTVRLGVTMALKEPRYVHPVRLVITVLQEQPVVLHVLLVQLQLKVQPYVQRVKQERQPLLNLHCVHLVALVT